MIIMHEIINRIATQQVTKDDVATLKSAFGNDIPGRKAFLAALDEILTDQDLHTLNSVVMKHANILSDAPNLLCRTQEEKVFADLLIMEAKRRGMQIKFDDNNNAQPLKPQDIPDAILAHYNTLQKHFYNDTKVRENNKSNYDINSLVSQSINFLLYPSLLRDTKTYQDWSDETKMSTEIALQDMKGQYIKQLSDSNIAQHAINHKQVKFNSDPQKNISSNDKVNNIITIYGNNLGITTEKIVLSAIEQYENNNKLNLDNSTKTNATKILTNQLNDSLLNKLEKNFYPTLVINSKKIADIITKGLEKIKINKLNIFNKFKNFNEENLLTIINKVPEKIGITKNKSNINRKPQISPVIKGDVDEILNKLSKMPNLSEKEKMLLQKPTNITNKPKSQKSHTI
ncbi:hypothetical protein BA173_00495 [Rickettsia sp. MEAM1 (Bemisia tabaci)]|nr:DUF5410 family protein [Rickettsia sp. MEAM1 (Bemisia tabaci)]ASX27423.1 hypothetical protein BA173_00495 [Rickettsia sp. MEAM1 (Bemisia tabaci)]ODA38535.1 hypothetical protein A8V33_04455 [Rickettsia sp. wb]ODA38689.1 hypothetical protein A8V34_03325 [Rickettsia sp. wq]